MLETSFHVLNNGVYNMNTKYFISQHFEDINYLRPKCLTELFSFLVCNFQKESSLAISIIKVGGAARREKFPIAAEHLKNETKLVKICQMLKKIEHKVAKI